MKDDLKIPNAVMNDVCLISSEALQKIISTTAEMNPKLLVGMKRRIERMDGSSRTVEYLDFDDVGGQHVMEIEDMFTDHRYGALQ